MERTPLNPLIMVVSIDGFRYEIPQGVFTCAETVEFLNAVEGPHRFSTDGVVLKFEERKTNLWTLTAGGWVKGKSEVVIDD